MMNAECGIIITFARYYEKKPAHIIMDGPAIVAANGMLGESGISH